MSTERGMTGLQLRRVDCIVRGLWDIELESAESVETRSRCSKSGVEKIVSIVRWALGREGIV